MTGSTDKAAYVAAMGDEAGEVACVLNQRLLELHLLWAQYKALFAAKGTVDLLNRSAALFFRVVHDEFLDSVLLGISRLTDPPGVGSRRNLTLRSLPPLVGDEALRAELEDLCFRAGTAATYARDQRNKRIAHGDHAVATRAVILPGLSRDALDAILGSLADVLNVVNARCLGTTVAYEHVDGFGDARSLLNRLRRLERLQAAREAVA